MNHAQATLHAWREAGLDGRDPVRFRLIDVLAQRAQGYTGAARQVLDARVSALISAYAQAHGADPLNPAPDADAHAAQSPAEAKPDGDAPQADAEQTLPALTAYLRARPRTDLQNDAAASQTPRDTYPELAALDDFRVIWEHLRTDKQVQESLQQVPGENAGPLNSGNIVHRSLSLMRTLSPEYLRQFMTYLDGLSALERLCQAGDPAGLLVAKLDGNRKGGRKAR